MKIDIFKNKIIGVECKKCGLRLSRNSINRFKYGWPECCGYTMTLKKYELKENHEKNIKSRVKRK